MALKIHCKKTARYYRPLASSCPQRATFFHQLLVFDGSSIDPHVTVTVEVDYVVGDVAADDDEYGILGKFSNST